MYQCELLGHWVTTGYAIQSLSSLVLQIQPSLVVIGKCSHQLLSQMAGLHERIGDLRPFCSRQLFTSQKQTNPQTHAEWYPGWKPQQRSQGLNRHGGWNTLSSLQVRVRAVWEVSSRDPCCAHICTVNKQWTPLDCAAPFTSMKFPTRRKQLQLNF